MMRRKETSLLVESWRNFINENEGEESKTFAECYVDWWKRNGKNIDTFGGIGSHARKEMTPEEISDKTYLLKKENFHHLLYYLSQIPSKIEVADSQHKQDWKDFCMGQTKGGELNTQHKSVPVQVYLDYSKMYNDEIEPDEKLNDSMDMKKVTTYINTLLQDALRKGESDKEKNPFHGKHLMGPDVGVGKYRGE